MTSEITTPAFKEKGREAIADEHLQTALTKLRTGFGAMRADAIDGIRGRRRRARVSDSPRRLTIIDTSISPT